MATRRSEPPVMGPPLAGHASARPRRRATVAAWLMVHQARALWSSRRRCAGPRMSCPSRSRLQADPGRRADRHAMDPRPERQARPYGCSDAPSQRPASFGAVLSGTRRRRTTMSREPEDIDMPRHGASPTQQGRGGPASPRAPEGVAARIRARGLLRSPRWIGRLALLDSWSPAAGHRLSPRRATWNDVLIEWTRAGHLTRAQAGALLALDETTPWQD